MFLSAFSWEVLHVWCADTWRVYDEGVDRGNTSHEEVPWLSTTSARQQPEVSSLSPSLRRFRVDNSWRPTIGHSVTVLAARIA